MKTWRSPANLGHFGTMPGSPPGAPGGGITRATPQKSPNPSTGSSMRGAVARRCSHGICNNDRVFGRRGGGGFWNGHFHRLRGRTVRRFGNVVEHQRPHCPSSHGNHQVEGRGRRSTSAGAVGKAVARRAHFTLAVLRTAHPTSRPRCRRRSREFAGGSGRAPVGGTKRRICPASSGAAGGA
jgi:hypothetical protein